MSEFNVLQSVTWPFEEYHQDIPQGLFVDAHVVASDSCSLNAATVSAGSIFLSLTVVKDNVPVEVSSGTVPLNRNSIIKFYNAVGKCFGWLLTGDVLPSSLVIQNVSYTLAGTVCLPQEGYTPANRSDMTGAWEVVGENGITVDPEYDEDTGVLNLLFGTDESWYSVEDPNYAKKSEGDGIWTINGLSGSVKIVLENGKIFPELDEDNNLLGLEFVPDLVFFSSTPWNTGKKHSIFKVGLNDHSWSGTDGTVTESNGVFTVTTQDAGGTATQNVKINETAVNTYSYDQKLIQRLAIRWAGCPDNDPFRDIVKTSRELNMHNPLPLDSVLTGSSFTNWW